MFRNYLLITLRSFRRDFGYALINLLGLGVGMACFVILALHLESELTYDRHFENHRNIYRVINDRENNGVVAEVAATPRELGPMLAQDYPEIRNFVRFGPTGATGRLLLRKGNRKAYWPNVWLADDQVFEVFSHDIIAGDPHTALQDPLAIAISETLARFYFDDENPIGQTLVSDTAAYTVTLVFEDLPENTHLKYSALLSYNRLAAFLSDVNVSQSLWWGLLDYTYLVMPDGYEPADFQQISDSFYGRYMAEVGRQLNSVIRYRLEPLAAIHLNSTAQADQPRGSRFYVYTFATIALSVLLVACFNYINLATARSVRRTREVGMRKVLGAHREHLIGQFLGEALVFSLLSLCVAVVLVHIAIRYTPINHILGASLEFDLIERPILVVPLGVLAVVVGLVSGTYPAFHLSTIQPIAALRGSSRTGTGKGAALRQILVFLQFAISMGVIACTFLMAIQMRYVQTKPLGFDKDNVVVITMKGADLLERTAFIKGDLTANSRIVAVSLSPNVPGERGITEVAQVEQNDGTMSQRTVRAMGGDSDYFKVLGIRLIQGRRIDPATPRANVVYVNEVLVKAMGWSQPIGKRIYDATVIGVVRDFHHASLHEPIGPLYLFNYWVDFEGVDALNRAISSAYLYVKIRDDDVRGTLAYLEKKFAEYDPKHPFEYRFLDDLLAQQYVLAERQMQLIGIFAGVCILLCCLGLSGLAAFTTAQRTKEIGIRKVLGASNGRIVAMLCKEIAGLVLVASLVASAVSYYAISNWLAGFQYKEDVSPLIFLVVPMLALAIAFATVALQSIETARKSPSVALRYDQ